MPGISTPLSPALENAYSSGSSAQSSTSMGFFPTEGNSNPYWNGIDFFLPGVSLFNSLFDPTGSSAAKQQAQSQLYLNQQAQGFNAEEAAKQRAWEEKMSSSQYQRMVKDLEAAGLNPYLAMSQLSPGGTPSGSAASSSSGSADMANNKLTAAAGVLAVILRMILAKH